MLVLGMALVVGMGVTATFFMAGEVFVFMITAMAAARVLGVGRSVRISFGVE